MEVRCNGSVRFMAVRFLAVRFLRFGSVPEPSCERVKTRVAIRVTVMVNKRVSTRVKIWVP